MSVRIYDRGRYIKKQANDDGITFEQQLATLTSAALDEKLPILRPYAVGFQTIDKNDDNTEGIGTMIYLIGTQTVYVPAFFRKSALTTGDVMVLADVDQCLPAEEAWINEVRKKDSDSIGILDQDQASQVTKGAPGAIRSREWVDPISKAASVRSTKVINQEVKGSWDGSVGRYSDSIFDIAIGLGKKACETLVNTLKDTKVLNSVLNIYSADDIVDFTKTACKKFPDVHHTPAHIVEAFSKEAAALTDEEKHTMMMMNGYLVKKAEGIGDVRVVPANAANTELHSPGAPGFYNVLMRDGSMKKALCIPFERQDACYCDKGVNTKKCAVMFDETPVEAYIDADPHILCAETDSTADEINKALAGVGTPVDTVDELHRGDLLIAPSGQIMALDDRYQTADNGKWVCPYYMGDRYITMSDEVNRIYKVKGAIRIPKGTKVLIPIECFVRQHSADPEDHKDDLALEKKVSKYSPAMATDSDLTEMVTGAMLKQYKDVKLYSNGTDYSVSDDDDVTTKSSRKEAALHLVSHYGVSPVAAENMLASVTTGVYDTPKSARYYVQKTAALSQTPGYDFGASPNDAANIGAAQLTNPGPTVDAVSMSAQFPGMSREQIQAKISDAANKGIKEVFDVTMLQAMLQDYDPVHELKQQKAALMTTLDKLCRMLLQVYSQPEAFTFQFGEAKLKSLTETLKSTINNLSDIILHINAREVAAEGFDNHGDPDDELIEGAV